MAKCFDAKQERKGRLQGIEGAPVAVVVQIEKQMVTSGVVWGQKNEETLQITGLVCPLESEEREKVEGFGLDCCCRN